MRCAGSTIRASVLEIQVLDDSTDETRQIAELAVRRHAAQGIDIKYIHRDGSHRVTRPARWTRA